MGHAGEEGHVGRGGMNKIRGQNSLFTQSECCGESQVKSGHALEKEELGKMKRRVECVYRQKRTVRKLLSS